jgi:hypothetical protein
MGAGLSLLTAPNNRIWDPSKVAVMATFSLSIPITTLSANAEEVDIKNNRISLIIILGSLC